MLPQYSLNSVAHLLFSLRKLSLHFIIWLDLYATIHPHQEGTEACSPRHGRCPDISTMPLPLGESESSKPVHRPCLKWNDMHQQLRSETFRFSTWFYPVIDDDSSLSDALFPLVVISCQ